jgi:cellulose synthase/poly-beta-1,6-N-acetylglucosamine synthase-like glycosyltransferase
VLVIDQSGDGRTRDLVSEIGDHDVVYVPTDTRGLSAARNVAVGRATGEVLAFTDDDCLADQGWLGALADEFSALPDVAVVCGRSLPLVETPLVASAASVRTDEERRLFNGPCSPWRVGNGSNMAFRKDVLRKIGPFDERLGPGARLRGGEEADVIYRFLKGGHQLLYSPRPLVYHRQWRNAAQQLALSYDYGVGVGAFCAKYLRSGDVRVLRALGGWTVATLRDIAGGVRLRQGGRVRAATRFLRGLAMGVTRMMLLSTEQP